MPKKLSTSNIKFENKSVKLQNKKFKKKQSSGLGSGWIQKNAPTMKKAKTKIPPRKKISIVKSIHNSEEDEYKSSQNCNEENEEEAAEIFEDNSNEQKKKTLDSVPEIKLGDGQDSELSSQDNIETVTSKMIQSKAGDIINTDSEGSLEQKQDGKTSIEFETSHSKHSLTKNSDDMSIQSQPKSDKIK